MEEPAATGPAEPPPPDDYTTTIPSRFRFKTSKRRNTHRSASPHADTAASSTTHRHKRRRHHRARSPAPSDPPPLTPDAAFREALFDALADDEGAAYWQGVYDQPLHGYADTKAGPDGELERMDDDEYAAYVRARMYEKTHQHVVEERVRREEARRRGREERARGERERGEAEVLRGRVEESLRRGEERRRERAWRTAWEGYRGGWERLGARKGEGEGRELVPWPVQSRQVEDVRKDEVEEFFRHAPGTEGAAAVRAMLKAERVRWHPDKMQQRLGSQNLDVRTMKAITAVFQVVDRMYNESKAGG